MNEFVDFYESLYTTIKCFEKNKKRIEKTLNDEEYSTVCIYVEKLKEYFIKMLQMKGE